MLLRHRWLVVGLLLAAAAGSLAAAEDVGVIMVTDMTAAGRKLQRPDRANPVYYQAINVGFQSYGRALAGDREPPNDEFLQLVLRTLRDEGYRPSSGEHPPTLLLAFAWGSLRGEFGAALRYLGGEKLDLMWEAEQASTSMLDPRVLTRNLRSSIQQRVIDLAGDDLYVLTIAAYDRDEAVRGKIVPLWETRIACNGRRNWAENALKQIVRVAGPAIGRDMDRPQWLPPSETRRRAEVEIGELETMDSSELNDAVYDLTKETDTR